MIWVKVAFISNKPPLVVEHAFPLTGFVGFLGLQCVIVVLQCEPYRFAVCDCGTVV